jgi:SAM-dependent methyltransferase
MDYDLIPYPFVSHHHAHPDRLAVVAALFGLASPPVATCRVLELGCAAGGNLLPMAYALPQAQLTGLDLSARQIEAGQRAAAVLGLRNVRLEQADVLAYQPEPGAFDYVIAHGLYAWTPPAVQAQILEICRRALTPNGVAFISYNVQPGWALSAALRQGMRFAARQASDPQARLRQALRFLELLEQHVGGFSLTYQDYLLEKIAELRADGGLTAHELPAGELPLTDARQYWYHEYLEEYNQPLYFHQFAEQAAAHALQYLGDAEPAMMYPFELSPAKQAALGALAADLLETEQYLDFIRNRTFRESLLCHAEARLKRQPGPAELAGLRVRLAGPVAWDTPLELHDDSPAHFRLDDRTLTLHSPASKAAILHLAKHPQVGLPFPELTAAAEAMLRPPPAQPQAVGEGSLAAEIAETVLLIYTESRWLELSTLPDPPDPDLAHPCASPVVRYQASLGGPVTSLRHKRLEVDDIDRQLLPLLDGQHNRRKLVSEMGGKLFGGKLEQRLLWYADQALLI